MNITVYTDGASRGNPGPAGIGVALYDEEGTLLDEYREYLGHTTNNVAEYRALVAGLRCAGKYAPCRVRVHLDSELLYFQMTGAYRVKSPHLLGLHRAARALAGHFERADFVSIPREQNKVADRLANEAIDLLVAGTMSSTEVR